MVQAVELVSAPCIVTASELYGAAIAFLIPTATLVPCSTVDTLTGRTDSDERDVEAERHEKTDDIFHRPNGQPWMDVRDAFGKAVRVAGLFNADHVKNVTLHSLRTDWTSISESLNRVVRGDYTVCTFAHTRVTDS